MGFIIANFVHSSSILRYNQCRSCGVLALSDAPLLLNNYDCLWKLWSVQRSAPVAVLTEILDQIREILALGENGIPPDKEGEGAVLNHLVTAETNPTVVLSFFNAMPPQQKREAIQWKPIAHSKGNTLLMDACLKRNEGLANAILDFGCDLRDFDHEGNTVLVYANDSNSVDVMSRLLDEGADPNQLNAAGKSPLMVCCGSSRNAKPIELLLSHGADPHFVDKEGVSVRDIAKEFGREDVLALLDRHDAVLQAKTLQQITPLAKRKPRARRI